MKPTRRLTLRRRSSSDEGMVLVAVLGAMIVLSLFALATLAYAMQSANPNRKDQDAKAALAAAQAGIDDYLSRLNNDPSYYNQGNDPTNPAFASSKQVTGSTAGGKFSYKLLTTPGTTVASGYIRLQSTGTVNKVSRTLTARLSPQSFLQYIYHTDKEDLDPVFYDSSDPSLDTKCNQYYYAWGSNPGRSSYSPDPCIEIQFGNNDVINGPMHTNDAIQIGGTVTFSSPRTETSWNTAATNKWWGSGAPSGTSNKPVYAAMVTIPPSNSGLLTYATPPASAASTRAPPRSPSPATAR